MGSKFNSEQTMEIEGGALDGSSKSEERTYLCIDLKSFYASVECADRGLDPFTTNLVVADPTRSANTICLAITPAVAVTPAHSKAAFMSILANDFASMP